MEESLNKRSPGTISALQELPSEASTSVKKDPFKCVSNEHTCIAVPGIKQEASSSNIADKNALPDEVEVSDTGIQSEDTIFTIEEVDVKAENMSTDDNEEIEDDYDTLGTNTADETNEETPSRNRRKLKMTSNEDRERIVLASEKGSSVATIAKSLNIKRGTVYNVLRKYHNTMKIEADKRGRIMEKKIPPLIRDKIEEWVNEDCGISLQKIKEKIFQEFKVQVCRSTVAKEITDFHYSIKRLCLYPERQNEGDNLTVRKEYAIDFTALRNSVPEDSIVFVDEVSFQVSMRIMRVRSNVGTAAKTMPQIRTRNISVVCAMNKTSIVHYKTHYKAVDSSFFVIFMVELREKLRSQNIANSIIVMDNVPFHKCTEIKELFAEGPDRIQYLPPYSPFLNPIEHLFSKWKEVCNRANPETEEEVMNAMENGKSLVTSSDCENCFSHMYSYILRCLREESIND